MIEKVQMIITICRLLIEMMIGLSTFRFELEKWKKIDGQICLDVISAFLP